MKRTLTILSLLLVVGFCFQANASNYKIDQNSIDQLVAKAEAAPAISVFDLQAAPELAKLSGAKDPVVAFILCTVVGYIGVHRLYLGTKPLTFVLYVITAGGCGIVVLVDWIMLLMVLIDKKDMGPYIDNPNFFMWKNQMN
jgi:TM2 domain-containing membrane protein YozV